MKKALSTLLPVGLAAVGVLLFVRLLPGAERPNKPDPYRGLKLYVQLQQKLVTAGQTNLAAELDRVYQTILLDSLTFELRNEVGILRRLQEGKTNVIELLEMDLDQKILSLPDFGVLGPEQTNALQAAKAYRAKYPRKTDDPKTDADVARILDQAKAK